jgi:hypothetical protein
LFASLQEENRGGQVYTCVMSDTNSVPENLDAVLRKYGKIWIWSILSTAVAALSVRAINNSSIMMYQGITGTMAGMRSPWTPLVMLWAFVPSLGTLAAVYFLLQFLRYHILPTLFPPSTPPAVEPAPESQDFTLTGAPAGTSEPAPIVEAVPDGGQLLLNAFAAIAIGMFLEALGVVGSIVYRALN